MIGVLLTVNGDDWQVKIMHISKRRIIGIWVAIFIYVVSTVQAATNAEFIARQVNEGFILGHVKVLSETIGVRVTTSPEEKLAGQYIARQLASYGYNVEYQPVPFENTVAYLKGLSSKTKYLIKYGAYSPLTPAGGICAAVVKWESGNMENMLVSNVKGKIALIKRERGDNDNKILQNIQKAQMAGAVAAIIQNFDWQVFDIKTTTDWNISIPYCIVNESTGNLLLTESRVQLLIKKFKGSQNIIAALKPRGNHQAGKIVTVTAHYDSVPASPGASDNASGVGVLLETARIISKLPVNNEVRFIAFGAEEPGLIGSEYYVSQLTKDEQKRIIANFNMDMIGTSGPLQNKLHVITQDSSDATRAGWNLICEKIFGAAKRLGYADMVDGPTFRPASDQVNFYGVGVPAANISWRQPLLEPWYHQPRDTVEENISSQRLKIGAQIVATAVYEVLQGD